MTSYTNNDIAEATEMLKEMLNVGKVSDTQESSKNSMNGVEDIVVPRRKDSDPFVTRQQIVLRGTDDSFSYAVEGEQVTFTCSPSDHTTGSSKVKIKNIVNFGWESKYYHGRLVAVHVFGIYFAYAIKTSAKEAAVRVINRNFESRTLLKGMKGSIQDLSFAHGTSEVILAAVDEEGNLFVYEIKDDAENVLCSPLLIIWSSELEKRAKIHLLKWCPYIPENPPDENGDNLSKLLLATHDNMACLWSVGIINKLQGPGPFNSCDVNYGGRTRIQDHDKAIIEGLISPDGSAVATASLSGEVKFFQLNTADSDSNLKCIHNWKPHDGKPLSCLLFLDDFKKPNFETQFWKYSVTGTDNNCELKVWSCETWNCLQTLRFEAPVGDPIQPCLKPYLDLSANYLLLSDINRRNLYVLQIQQDTSQNVVSVYCISEFPFNYPIVSFAILDAGRKKYKLILDAENVFEQSEYDRTEMQLSDGMAGEDSYVEGIVVKMLLIQPKSLQECSIVFQPAVCGSENAWSVCTMSQDSLMVADRLSDVSMDIATSMETGSSHYSEDNSLTPSVAHSFGTNKPQLLLTPDSFASHSLPGTSTKQDSANIRLNLSLDSALGALSSINHCSASSSVAKSDNLLVDISEDSAPSNVSQTTGLSRQSPANHIQDTVSAGDPTEEITGRFNKTSNSTGSSPSLEVQEILAPQSDEGKGEEVFFGQSTSQNNGDVTDSKEHLGVTDMISLGSPNEGTAVSQNVRRSSLQSPAMRTAQSPQFAQQSSAAVKLPGNPIDNMSNEVAMNKEILQDVASKVEHLEHDFKTFVSSVQQENLELMEMMKALTICMTEKNANMESMLRSQESRMLSALSQTVNNSIVTKMQSVVATEFKNTVVPSMSHMVDPLQSAIQTAVNQKLTATDIHMREAVTKLIKSKPTMDAIGNATALQLHHLVGTAFKDVCHAAIIPAFEKASQAMLKQISDTFQNGLKEYCHHLESVLTKRLSSVDKNMENAESKLLSAAANLQSSATNLKSEMNVQIDEKLKMEFARLEDNLITKMHKVVRDTVSGAIKEQMLTTDRTVDSIRSRSVTPVVDAQLQQKQITHLLRSGNYNAAFEQALSVSDLKMVVYTCKQIEPSKVFSIMPCVLQQPVLLSLIQQLAVDLLTETHLKLKYIEESVTQLDKLHPATSSHIAGVLKTLHSQLHAFIKDNPTSEHRTKLAAAHLGQQGLSTMSTTSMP